MDGFDSKVLDDSGIDALIAQGLDLKDANDKLRNALEHKDKCLAEAHSKIEELTEQLNKAKTESEKKVRCLRCGRDAASTPIKPQEGVLKHWFRCMLGQRPFSHEFKAFGGTLSIEFTELSGDMLNKQEALLKATKTEADYLNVMTMSIILAALNKVSIFDAEAATTTTLYEASPAQRLTNLDDLSQARAALVNTVGQTTFNVIRQASTVFVALLNALVEQGQDENFFEGAGLL